MSESNKITSYFKSKSGIIMPPKVNKSIKKIRQSSLKKKSDMNFASKPLAPAKQVVDYDSDCCIVDEKLPISLNGMTDDVIPLIETLKNDNHQGIPLIVDSRDQLNQQKKYNANVRDVSRDIEYSDKLNNQNSSLIDAELDSMILEEKSIDTPLHNDNPLKKEYEDSTIFLIQMVESFLLDTTLHYLFEEWEISLIRCLQEIEAMESKKVFARMYWIMWKWYKSSAIISKYLKLDYQKDKASQKFIAALQECGFLLNGKDMNLDEWTEVLTRNELYDVCKHFKISSSSCDRTSLITDLKAFCSPKSTILLHFGRGQSKSIERNVINKMSSLFGDCIKITEDAKLVFDKLFKLVYLGANPAMLREKKLNLLLINIKIGKQSYPSMNLKPDSPSCAFPSKLHFVEYFAAHTIYEEILKLTSTPQCDHEKVVELCRKCCQLYKNLQANKDLISWIAPSWLLRFTPGYCYIKSIEIGIGSFKAQKELYFYEEALQMIDVLLNQNIYRQHKRALWYNEQTLILQSKLRKFQQAADVLIQALNETGMSEDSKAPLKDRAKRIASLKNATLNPETRLNIFSLVKEESADFPSIHISARTTSDNAPGRKSQYYFRDVVSGEKTYSGVEQYAILHYLNNTEYSNGEHWEGRIITSLFGLLFWDIVYAPLEAGKGIFLSPYQEVPLDLYTDDFYKNRKDLIESRLIFIEYGWEQMDDIIIFMKEIFDSRKSGEVSVFHDGIEWEQIAEIVTCLGRDCLLSVCKRLASVYYYCHSGFPDLTVWNPKTKKIKFVEVKGDGDRLSFKQIQWMKYLLKSGIQTEVCFVHKSSFSNNDTKKGISKKSPKKDNKSPGNRRTKKRADKTECVKIESADINSSSSNIHEHPNENTNCDFSNVNSPKKDVINIQSPKKSMAKKRKSASPKVSPSCSQESGVYLRSPSKISKGVGYFTSPTKNEGPDRVRKRLSLSLTRKRITDNDK